MDSQRNRTPDGTEPPPEQEPRSDGAYRWFDCVAGLSMLAAGLLGLSLGFGSDRLSATVFCLGLILTGLLDLLICLRDLFGRRRGGALRGWPLLVRTLVTLLVLVSGLTLMLGY